MALPSYMSVGRGMLGGPVAGGYCALTFGPIQDTDGGDSDTINGVALMPVGFRVEAVSWYVQSTVGTGVSFNVHKNTSAAIDASETDLLSAAADIDANATGIARVTGTTPTVISGAAGTTNDVGRNLDRGDYLIVTTNSDVTTGRITNLYVQVWGFVLDHANVSPGDD